MVLVTLITDLDVGNSRQGQAAKIALRDEGKNDGGAEGDSCRDRICGGQGHSIPGRLSSPGAIQNCTQLTTTVNDVGK